MRWFVLLGLLLLIAFLLTEETESWGRRRSGSSDSRRRSYSDSRRRSISVARRRTISVTRRRTISVARRRTISVARRRTISVARRRTISVARRRTISVARRRTISVARRRTISVVRRRTISLSRRRSIWKPRPTWRPPWKPVRPTYGPVRPPWKPVRPTYGPVRPPWKPVRPTYGPARPPWKPVRPTYGPVRPPWKPVRPTYGPVRPPWKPVRPTYGPVRPPWKPVRPTYGPVRPPWKPVRPTYGPVRPPWKPVRPTYGPVRPPWKPVRPTFGPVRHTYGPVRPTLKTQQPKGTSSPTSTEDPLKVSQGQITFNVEGNDNKNSILFSRKPHVPPGSWSGVTIGRGFDMGQRSPDDIKKDLVTAGVDEKTADKLKNAAGLKGEKARDFLKKKKLQDFTLTREQQKKLFEIDYPRYVSKAKKIVEKYSISGVKFNSLSPVAKDIATDIMYRGDYSMSNKNKAKKKRSQRIQKVLESKSLQKLKDLMSDKKFWDAAGVDKNRFNERKKAVEAACKSDPNCN